ncbi:hypothetical protein N7448_011449 [Penicillium atrosanguineum]|uniref:Uncharacterized protein n=1 Tax=Penicillium atrosanguineum TaxID=1132637 RepID=A0A9W9KTM0_9EURO|nr:hypothetical protein N7448_011449 [Penicillium atrosanguineum]KAJ5144409.1 hypothetical protein N7526_001917 [Penicillium atrosanguineum]KAJ5318233.1 hypothetical protein N7476_004653 [Penicillium atrosanguineum]
MPHTPSAMSNLASIGLPAHSFDTREQADISKSRVRLPGEYEKREQSAHHFIVMLESPSRLVSNIDPYPWWEEEQCVLDTDSSLSDIEKSVKDELETDGWLPERGEQDALLDLFQPKLDAMIIAQLYILAVEDWLRREVKDADDLSPVDGDMDQ